MHEVSPSYRSSTRLAQSWAIAQEPLPPSPESSVAALSRVLCYDHPNVRIRKLVCWCESECCLAGERRIMRSEASDWLPVA